jgi:hypothetical protein
MQRIYHFSLVKSLDESKKPFKKITRQYASIPLSDNDLLSKLLSSSFKNDSEIKIDSIKSFISLLKKELNIKDVIEFFETTVELLSSSEKLSLEINY